MKSEESKPETSPKPLFVTLLRDGEAAINRVYKVSWEQLSTAISGTVFLTGLSVAAIILLLEVWPLAIALGCYGIYKSIEIGRLPFINLRKIKDADIAKANSLRKLVYELLRKQNDKWQLIGKFNTEDSSPSGFGTWNVWFFERRIIFLVRPQTNVSNLCSIIWQIDTHGDPNDIKLSSISGVHGDNCTLVLGKDTFFCKIDKFTYKALRAKITKLWHKDLFSKDPCTRIKALEVIASRGYDKEVVPRLIKMLKGNERGTVAAALGRLSTREAIPFLIEMLRDAEWSVTLDAHVALISITREKYDCDYKLWQGWWEKAKMVEQVPDTDC